MKDIIVIAGITAAGKSDAAIRLAQHINAEIISADSVAVYKEFNIGSAKPSLAQQEAVKHHLINVCSYKEGYDVARFQKEARACIKEIHGRNKPVIIVGGTGLYLKALLYDYRFDFEDSMENKYEHLSNVELFQRLMMHDPNLAETLHPNNRKRLIRALNAYDMHQATQLERTKNQRNRPVLDAMMFFLTGPREVMYQRINMRVDHMFEMGLVEEVTTLVKANDSFFENHSTQAIGYREFKEYFLGNQTLEETKALIKQDTRRFAKRQWTWFRHQMVAINIDITGVDAYEEIVKHIKNRKEPIMTE